MNLLPCPRCAAPVPPNVLSCVTCGAAVETGHEARPVTMMLMGFALTGCPIYDVQPAYGVAISDTGFIDNDEDGFAEIDGDCDDTNPDIHPDAEEIPGDEIDSNCNGEDDE